MHTCFAHAQKVYNENALVLYVQKPQPYSYFFFVRYCSMDLQKPAYDFDPTLKVVKESFCICLFFRRQKGRLFCAALCTQ